MDVDEAYLYVEYVSNYTDDETVTVDYTECVKSPGIITKIGLNKKGSKLHPMPLEIPADVEKLPKRARTDDYVLPDHIKYKKIVKPKTVTFACYEDFIKHNLKAL